MLPTPIPFNRPAIVGNEVEYVSQALRSGAVAGDHTFSKKCHAYLEGALGVPRALLTTSCTHALEMAAMLLDLQPGDEVILPSFTFVSTANAFVLRGARPVFADIREDTLNIDEAKLEELVTPRTRAVVVVHYAGVGCEMDTIGRVAAKHGLSLIEDNAHGLFGRYREKSLGTFGQLATQSFHETKNITCGEGGALLVNDARLIERAEILREKGTNRARFFRGQVDKYSWVDVGSSYLPSDVLAAYLLAQLEEREKIQSARRRIWQAYDTSLRDWFAATGARGPFIPQHCDQSHHMYYVLCPSLGFRTRLIGDLKEAGISAVFHYLPLHTSEMGARLGGKAECPVTTSVSERLVRLPLFVDLTREDQARVIDRITRFR